MNEWKLESVGIYFVATPFCEKSLNISASRNLSEGDPGIPEAGL